jgi:4-hydroxy-2-oxoheptanedioate aldolase
VKIWPDGATHGAADRDNKERDATGEELMTRVNRAIELLEAGQPIYYDTVRTLSYEHGVEQAGTWADYLNIELEHHPFAPEALHAFMRGLIEGGPTRSGHRTPAAIVTLPIDAADEHAVRANSWMIKQVLAAGVHGMLLCHAETPAAVRTFVEYSRFAYQTLGVGEGLEQGRRGAGGQALSADYWGMSTAAYLDCTDVWPLNPKGELMLGLKIENRRALANVEASVAVPGIAFAEWGPGDMGMSFGHKDAHDPPYPPEMIDARARVKAACDRAGVAFLDIVRADNAIAQVEDGVKVGAATADAAEIGRRHTGRTMPW